MTESDPTPACASPPVVSETPAPAHAWNAHIDEVRKTLDAPKWWNACKHAGHEVSISDLSHRGGRYKGVDEYFCADCSRGETRGLDTARAGEAETLSAHDHGNCELCDQIEAEVIALRQQLDEAREGHFFVNKDRLKAEAQVATLTRKIEDYKQMHYGSVKRAEAAESRLTLLTAGVRSATEGCPHSESDSMCDFCRGLHTLTEPNAQD